MATRYEVLMTLPPGGNGQRTRLALQQNDDGIARPAVLRAVMEGVTPFAAPAAKDVLALIDVVELDGTRWGVFELAPGATLRELAEVHAVAKRLPALGLVARVVVDAAKAIGAVHRLTPPAAHGGISDAALLAGFDGVTQVLDFGAPRSSRMMAPEQLRGAVATPPTDVFCLGAALHSAVTGYQGPYASAVSKGLDTLPWTSGHSDEGDPGLDQVMREALHPAPNMRWPDALTFAEQLESVAGRVMIDRNALAQVLRTLFGDRYTALRDAAEGRKRPASSPPAPRMSRPDLPAPRPSRANMPLLKAELVDAPPRPTGDGLRAPPASSPTANLRSPRPSVGAARPPRASPGKVPEGKRSTRENDVPLDEGGDVPTGASPALMDEASVVLDDAEISKPVARPSAPRDTDFDPSATTPAHKLKVPVPANFAAEGTDPRQPPRSSRPATTGLQVKMQTEEERALARGQEKISTSDLDPEERDDGLGGVPWNESEDGALGAEITDQPTNVRRRPKLDEEEPLEGDEGEVSAEPGADEVQGDATEPPKRMPRVAAARAEVPVKKRGGAARAMIAFLLLAMAAGGGYVALMRPDLMAKARARIRAQLGQKPEPVPEALPAEPVDAGEAAPTDGGPAEAAVVPGLPASDDAGEAGDGGASAAASPDAGSAAAEAQDAGAAAATDGGDSEEESDDGGTVSDGGPGDEDETAPPPTSGKPKKKPVKKKHHRHR